MDQCTVAKQPCSGLTDVSMKNVFATLLLSLLIAGPQSQAETSKSLQKKTTEAEIKITLARELVKILEFEKLIEDNMTGASDFLKRKPNHKIALTDVENEKLLPKAQSDFSSQKIELKNTAMTLMAEEFNKKFTLAELKYLVEAAKYPVIKKLTALINSDEYQNAINLPFNKANELLKNSKLQ